MVLGIILLVLGIVCMISAAVCLLFYRRIAAALPAYVALALLHASTYIYLPVKTFVFWGIATLIVAGIHRLLPQGEPAGRKSGNVYVGVAAVEDDGVDFAQRMTTIHYELLKLQAESNELMNTISKNMKEMGL